MRVLILSILVFGFLSVAAEECEKALAPSKRPTFTLVPSSRVPRIVEEYRPYLEELMGPGGILEKLGIEMTDQKVEFLQGRDLNAVTSGTAGGYPVSHYLDGAAVLRALKPRGGFALEVVYPGPVEQHGLYRDDNPKDQQISIIDHVVGHNNFAYHSGFAHYRVSHSLQATKRLDEILRDLYATYNKEEVQRYYLWTLTLARLMNWSVPFYEPIEKFKPELKLAPYDPLLRQKPHIRRHPTAPTENVLAAFAANIAPTEPTWKADILDLIHQSMAFRPALVHTQIMNEGYASIMQEILPRYSKNNHHPAFWFSAQQVMQTENFPKLHDPYSLGVFCWRRIRERLFEQPEIKSMKTMLEKDRAFFQLAKEIIQTMDDEQFLRFAIDQRFIDRFKLSVVRRATQKEMDPDLPPPKNPSGRPIAQWIVVTRERERVVQAIIDSVLKPKYIFNPAIQLKDFNRPQTGEVELVLDDPVSNALALEQTTLTPAMYALTQIIGKPVSLEANIALKIGWKNWELVRVRAVVGPTGEVQIYRKGKGSEVLDDQLTALHQHYLKTYLEDLYLDDPDEWNRLQSYSSDLPDYVTKAIARAIDDVPYGTVMVHAPNSAGAILEYQTMVQKRILKALERGQQNGKGMAMLNGQLRVRALPSAVYFQFDAEHANAVMAQQPPAPVDGLNINRTFEKPFGDYMGGDGRVAPTDGKAGDRFWGPGDPPDGGGRRGTKPGEDPNDLSWVDVPADLYARFLGERVRMPILNRKPGQSRTKAKKPGKRINMMHGQYLPLEIMENAFRRGVGKKLSEDLDPFEDIDGTIGAGFAEMRPRDWVVKSQKVAKKPDAKAVVIFVLDASGSTMNYMEAFKRFVHDMKTLVAANYKGFDFRYIIFDTQAHIMKSENDFFRAELGGGTLYTTGIKKALELHRDEYPRSAWDRYTFLMGDMEDFSPDEAMAAIKELLEESEFFGVVAGLNGGPEMVSLQLLQRIEQERQSNPQVGVTILGQDGGYGIQNIREVLRNEEQYQ